MSAVIREICADTAVDAFLEIREAIKRRGDIHAENIDNIVRLYCAHLLALEIQEISDAQVAP